MMTRETWVQNSGLVRKITFGAFLDFVSTLSKSIGSGLKQRPLERVGSYLGLYRPIKDVVKDLSQRAGGVLTRDVLDLAKSFAKFPRAKGILFWIDDLDRSTVEVQLAFLKQIYAHRERLGVPVIIAMDPTDVLKRQENSDNHDLLRKVFTATLTLPAKKPEQFIFYAQDLCSELFPDLSSDTVHQVANLISYVTSGNPRFVKRYLNNLAAARHRIELDYPGNLTEDELPGLARWILAQTKWPLLFNYHGEEELILSLLNRATEGTPVEASLNSILESLLRNHNEITQEKDDAIHFLQQTRWFATQHELKILSWLVGQQDTMGDSESSDNFDWFGFWDLVERGEHKESIGKITKSGLPKDFLEHIQARISRWIHQRCFAEAVEILQVFWKMAYEDQGAIEAFAGTTEADKTMYFEFILQALGHQEIAAQWSKYPSFPDLEYLFQFESRLPEDWLIKYLSVQFHLNLDYQDFQKLVLRLFELPKYRSRFLYDEKIINLITEWFIENWSDYREELQSFWTDQILRFEDASLFFSAILSSAQQALEHINSDDDSYIEHFLSKSEFYVWFISLLYSSGGRAELEFRDFTAWYFAMDSIFREQEISEGIQDKLLDLSKCLVGIQILPLMAEDDVPEYKLKAIMNEFVLRVKWQSLLRKITAKKYLPSESGTFTHIECGLLLTKGLALFSSILKENMLIDFFDYAFQNLNQLASKQEKEIVSSLLDLIIVKTRQDFFPPEIVRQLYEQLFLLLGRLKDNPDHHDIIAKIWYRLTWSLLTDEPMEKEDSTRLTDIICFQAVFDKYLSHHLKLKGFDRYFFERLNDDDEWRNNLCNLITKEPGPVFSRRIKILGRILEVSKTKPTRRTLENIQECIEKNLGNDANLAFRFAILAGDLNLWNELDLPEKATYSLLKHIERFLKDPSNPSCRDELAAIIIEAGQDANLETEFRNALPFFNTFANSLANSGTEESYVKFVHHIGELCSSVAIQTDNATVSSILEKLRDQI